MPLWTLWCTGIMISLFKLLLFTAAAATWRWRAFHAPMTPTPPPPAVTATLAKFCMDSQYRRPFPRNGKKIFGGRSPLSLIICAGNGDESLRLCFPNIRCGIVHSPNPHARTQEGAMRGSCGSFITPPSPPFPEVAIDENPIESLSSLSFVVALSRLKFTNRKKSPDVLVMLHSTYCKIELIA